MYLTIKDFISSFIIAVGIGLFSSIASYTVIYNDGGFLSVFLFMFSTLPFVIAYFFTGFRGLLLSSIVFLACLLLFFTIDDIMVIYFFGIYSVLPVFVLFITLKISKRPSFVTVAFALYSLIVFLITFLIEYYNGNKLIYDIEFVLYMISIMMKLDSIFYVEFLDKYFKIAIFLLPFVISIMISFLLLMNYYIGFAIAKKSNKYLSDSYMKIYNIPSFYIFLFVSIVAMILSFDYFVVKKVILSYNVSYVLRASLLILLIPFVFSGIGITQIFLKNRLFLSFVFYVMLVFFSLYIICFLILLGIVREIGLLDSILLKESLKGE